MKESIVDFMFDNGFVLVSILCIFIVFIILLLIIAFFLKLKEKKIDKLYLELNLHFEKNFEKIIEIIVFLKNSGIPFYGTVINEIIGQRMNAQYNKRIGNIKKQFLAENKIIKSKDFLNLLLTDESGVSSDLNKLASLISDYSLLVEQLLKTKNSYNKNIRIYNRGINISLVNKFFGEKFFKCFVFWE